METRTKKKKIDYHIPEDLWINILARLTIKSITAFKSVCKEWKTILESRYLHDCFKSHHRNSYSSWSLMCRDTNKEVMAHYGCNVWGLQRSLNSYISSFLTHKFGTQKDNVIVEAYTDVGLILIILKPNYYVANPISRQCVEIPLPRLHQIADVFKPSGLVTRTINGVLLDYKVVLMDKRSIDTGDINVRTYSSETGLWSLNSLESDLPLRRVDWFNPISLNRRLYWLGRMYDPDYYDAVVSHNFYLNGKDSNQCRVILFPDVDKKVNIRRACTTSQGSLMYMNIVSEEKADRSFTHKLCVWRLKRGDWQIVFETDPACLKSGLDYYPLTINPFDANELYLWTEMHKRFTSTNLQKGGKFEFHKNLKRSSDGRVLSFVKGWNPFENLFDSCFSRFVLPRWLHRIPSSPS